MTVVRMKDLSDGGLRLYSGMTDGQLKRGEGLGPGLGNGAFIAESLRVIERALDAGVRPISLFVEEHWFEHERPVIERVEADYPETTVYVASNGQFRELTGYEVTRGALAAFERPPLPSMDEVLEGGPPRRHPRGHGQLREHGIAVPLGGGAGNRCGAGLAFLPRSVLPSLRAGEHGGGVPGALDAHRRPARMGAFDRADPA